MTGEMVLVVVPSLCTSRKIADPWNPDAHAVLVDHVGVLFTEPLDGFSVTPPALLLGAALALHALRSTPAPIATTPASHFFNWSLSSIQPTIGGSRGRAYLKLSVAAEIGIVFRWH